MHAAILTAPDRLPVYAEHPDAQASRPGSAVVDVLAAGLHHLTRAKATGSHYSSGASFPLVPGVDGVVRDETGALRYVVLDDSRLGTFADRTVIDVQRSVLLPTGVDPVTIAAAMNPAMSSWVALRRRISMPQNARVLVIGATGAAGRLAVQVAKLFGASHVTAVGRDLDRLSTLSGLGADELVPLTDLAAAANADVVLDYIWGEAVASALIPMLTRRRDRSAPLTWIQLGSMAGETAAIPAAALRSARLEFVGSGIGSVKARDIITELPALADALTSGALSVDVRAVSLSLVEDYWNAPVEERVVFLPGS
jgi:NADPH:quinone reductase-like Zn-dependent oxidoreductase